jgi:hypothetical protein
MQGHFSHVREENAFNVAKVNEHHVATILASPDVQSTVPQIILKNYVNKIPANFTKPKVKYFLVSLVVLPVNFARQTSLALGA